MRPGNPFQTGRYRAKLAIPETRVKTMAYNLLGRAARSRPLLPLSVDEFAKWQRSQGATTRRWLESLGQGRKPGDIVPIPDGKGGIERIVVVVDAAEPVWSFGDLSRSLPAGTFRIETDLDADAATAAALGWAMGTYVFDRYAQKEPPRAHLVWPKGADRAAVERAVAATFLVRDLINTPAGDMGPPELASAARRLARRYNARCRVVIGDDLLRKNFPAVHAIGRAARKAPRLIDLSWGRRAAPRIALVGKGVCFDTGGLDLKTAAGMKLMKKDMGGAAHALGLADMIMSAGLDVRLRVLIPAVENAVGGGAVYPLDVVRSRSGRTIEIGHTDAEGRVVLADALDEARRDNPDLIVDFATLTGSARAAVGTEIAAMFCNDDSFAGEISTCAACSGDPVWRLPLWQPYADKNESQVADISNEPSDSYGGAISAALFLESFVGREIPWVHFDIMAWNTRARPGRPKGGEAMAMRATFDVLTRRYRRR